MTWTIMDLRTMALKNCNGMRVTAFLDTPGQDNLPSLARLQKYAFSAVTSSTGYGPRAP